MYEDVEKYQEEEMITWEKENKEILERMKLGLVRYTQEDYENDKAERLEYAKEQIRLFTEQRNSPEVLAEIEYRKNLNIKRLKEQKVI